MNRSFSFPFRYGMATLSDPLQELLIDAAIVLVEALVAAQVECAKGLGPAKQSHEVFDSRHD